MRLIRLKPRLPMALATLLVVAFLYAAPIQAAPSAESCVYTVRAGDTLGAIARRYNTSVAVLAELNEIANPNIIEVGQAITIPECNGASAPAPVPQGPPPTAIPRNTGPF